MTRRVWCLIVGACFSVSAQVGLITNVGPTVNGMDAIAFNSGGILYGGTSGAGSLYTINTATGAVTLVHALVGASDATLKYGVLGLAFEPGTGKLYGATSPDSPNSGNSLVTIDPATGQVTVIGPSGDGRPYTDISFAPDGKLYGWLIDSGGKTASAATINLETGAGTSLGNSQNNPGTQWAGLAVNSSGVIYVAANGHAGAPCGPQNCNGAFWTINPGNGAPTTIGMLSGGPGSAPTITALAFSPSGVLYGIEGGFGGTTWNLVTIRVSAVDAPAINSVTNAASGITPGLPNAGIAPGAIFVVYGTAMGPAKLSFAPAAFQSTTVSGTSIEVTVGGTKVDALMLYTSANQVAALLPSDTPAGVGTAALTYNGNTSRTVPIEVVANNVGLFTIDASGAGPGVVMYPDYSLVSAVKSAHCGGANTICGAANPGDTLILWATGLGAINGSDAAGVGLGENMPNIPLKLWLGGVQAKVNYQGRSGCCIGEDQIVFTVPENTPTGCAVPLVVQIGSEISNNVLIPVAKEGRSCTLVRPDYAPIGAEKIEELVTAGPVNSGSIRLDHFSSGEGAPHFEDDARFQFFKLTGYLPGTQPFFVSWIDDQPAGTCIVYNNLNQSLNNPITGGSGLDAGSSFKLMGPMGSVTLPAGNGKAAQFNATGSFLVPGTYTITGSGGANVGSFNGTFAIPERAKLVSPQNNGSATRANGMKVSWTGGSGNLMIELGSCSDNSCNNGAGAVCRVPASLGSFTIPAYVLEALPAGNFAGLVLSSYSEASFTATGLDAGSIFTYGNDSGFGLGWGSGSFTLK